MRTAGAPALAVLCVLALAGCAEGGAEAETAPGTSSTSSASSAPPTSSPASPPPTVPTPPPAPASPTTPAPGGPVPADGQPRAASLTVADIGLRDLEVVPYDGWTDDAPGTEIQNDGQAASPHGPRGGTGPGGVGNYQVTAHRNSAGGPFFDLPELADGARIEVTAGGTTYVYEVTETRETSFRSPASLRAQRAAVPGQPGVAPTQAMITLSTCATQEDHAEGNYWSDEFDNPEHRIDKIGVLVDTRPA